MKYHVKDDLSLFEFHDADLSLVSFDGRDLVVSARLLNIHKDTSENPFEYDMEIESAQISFENFRLISWEPGRCWGMDEDGRFHPKEPQVIWWGKDATDRLLEELGHGVSVYHFVKEDVGYSIGGCGIEPYFEFCFDFDHIEISWDAYRRKAWYERHRSS